MAEEILPPAARLSDRKFYLVADWAHHCSRDPIDNFPRGDKMNIFQHLARIAAEMTMQPDPYPDKYIPPEVTGTRREDCQTVYEVKAMNYRDVERLFDGVNVAGKVIIHTHVGRNKWEVYTEDL
jgi:hypothetical protein